MAGPIGAADLLGDQPVAGVLVGSAQQGFGQAHQGQAFAGAQAELLEEALDHALPLGRLARGPHQIDGLGPHARPLFGRQRAGGQQGGDRFGLVTILGGWVVESGPGSHDEALKEWNFYRPA